MRAGGVVPYLLPIALLALTGAPALERFGAADAPTAAEVAAESEALAERARALIDPGAPVFVGDCCRKALSLSAEELRRWRGRRFYLLLPRDQSPFDVRADIGFANDSGAYRSLQLVSSRDEETSLWWTTVRSKAMNRDDYFLSLQVGGFESRAEGRLYGSSHFDWRQNNEYRLLAFRAPLDPADPAFSLILEDQLLVTLTSAQDPGRLVPSVRPTVAFQPANLGVSMAGGRRTRYKISVGAGYGLAPIDPLAVNSAARGFLRFQIRFR